MEKLKISPNVMEIGKAGSAFLKIARSRRVKHNPCKEKQNIYESQDLLTNRDESITEIKNRKREVNISHREENTHNK